MYFALWGGGYLWWLVRMLSQTTDSRTCFGSQVMDIVGNDHTTTT